MLASNQTTESVVEELFDLLGCENLVALQAYCDESGKHEQSRVLLMAGYLGDKTVWEPLAQHWRTALADEKIEVFHSADCDGGYGEFAGMSYERRQDIQMRFLLLLRDSGLIGYWAGVLRRHFNLFEHLIKARRDKYWYPYFLVFQTLVELCGTHSMRRSLGDVSFVLDRQKEFSGRAVEIYNSIRDNKMSTLAYKDSLGAIAFQDKRKCVVLQAADVLAYESYRYATDVEYGMKSKRWQYDMIELTIKEAHVFSKSSMSQMIGDNSW